MEKISLCSRIFSITIISGALLLASCGNEEPTTSSTNIVKAGVSLDIGNDQAASDVLSVFSLSTVSGVEDIELILAPSSLNVNTTMFDLSSVSPTSIQTINVSGARYKKRLNRELLDINGDQITNTSYDIIYVITQNGLPLINQSKGKIVLSSKHVFEGKYQGTWDDNIYTGFGISAEITGNENRLSGIFYYSTSFTSCCGGNDDGTLRFVLDDADAITSFIYNQNLVSFMGGSCPGQYSGKGNISDLINLNINFEGNDCEGDHTDGRIVLTRIE